MRANAHELMQQAEGTDRGVVFDLNVTGELCTIDENGAVSDDAVMADVRVGHDELVAADPRDSAALDRAAMDGAVLAKFVRIANFEVNALAGVGQILGIAADHGKG